MIFDENTAITDNEKLPIGAPLTVLRYKTIKKSSSLGWWSAVVLLEDHGKKLVCFYRWHKKKGEWKRDKKLPFRNASDWVLFRTAIEEFIPSLDEPGKQTLQG
ncbi:MAG: hypothetical protein HQL30_12390 [Candidatus Omnitrophica bacterium]|nr:hypothetical protein [Candidatus Omnitrophota bacterium]